jgi:hypothetical protein
MANYRLISLLTSFSKVSERITYDRFLQHIEPNNILATEQFAFRLGAPTVKPTFRLISLNNRMMAGGIFCDPCKAFDCVNCSILLKKTEVLWNKRHIT